MTACQWNPKYDRPSLGGEGDCVAEAAWEVGDKYVLRLCHDCAGSKSFARFSKRPICVPERWPGIEDAKRIAKRLGLRGVIIFGFDDRDGFAYASYGRDRKECGDMNRTADAMFTFIEGNNV